MVNEINEDNFETAIAAIRDILYMYYDLVEGYEGFGHSIRTGSFNPIFFADCYLYERAGIGLGIDVSILHEGAAVAIICKLSDYWDENKEMIEDDFVLQVKRILSEGRLDHLPLAEQAIKIAFEDEDKFRDLLDEVYKSYVLQRFRKLSDN